MARSRSGRALQDAFVKLGGAQCGICTPGMIVAALPLKAGASLDEIKSALAGNLCRCTGYLSIFRSVQAGLRPSREALRPTRKTGVKGKRANAR